MQLAHALHPVTFLSCLRQPHPAHTLRTLSTPPGTFLPVLSWPIITTTIWLSLLHVRPRLEGADKRQAFAGVLASAMMAVFILQDGEFRSWGECVCVSSTKHSQKGLAVLVLCVLHP